MSKTEKVDDIENIMQEIESLQKEMNATDKPSGDKPAASLSLVTAFRDGANEEPEPDHSDLEEFQGSAGDASIEETLADVKGEPSEGKSILDDVVADEEVTQMGAKKTGAALAAVPSEGDACCEMTLSGNMTLKLKYAYEGQEVSIGFVDGALRVELTDGTEFKIPVGRK